MKILLLILLSFPIYPYAQTAREIVQNADETRMPSGDFSVDVQVMDYKNRQLQKETFYKSWSKGIDMSLVDTISPARQKGRKLLMIQNDLWFFTPDIKRPTRVSFQQKITGEVANGDLSRTNFATDYNANILSEEKYKGETDAWILKLEANKKTTTYSSIKYWVEKKTFLPLRADFFAATGKHLKTAIYSRPMDVMGKKRITSVLIQDAIQKSNESIIRYSGHKRENLNDSFFNKDNLGQ